jgi:tripeptidyl-peptidase-1
MYQRTIIKGLTLALCTNGLVDGMRLMHKTTSLHQSIKTLSTPPDDGLITLTIGLALQNVDQLGSHLQAVSEPSSPNYGSYLDLDGINDMFAPSKESRAAVHTWLRDAGVEHIADDGHHINFATSISKANLMLNSYFQNFDVDGVQKLRTREYSIPNHLAKHIDLVSPTTFFGRSKPQAVLPHAVDQLAGAQPLSQHQTRALPGLSVQKCAQLIEPLCLMALYNYPRFVASNASGSRVGFTSFLNQSAVLSDLHLYQKAYGLPNSNFSVALINGGVDHQYEPNLGGKKQFREANLDSQFLSAVTMTLPITEFITGGNP